MRRFPVALIVLTVLFVPAAEGQSPTSSAPPRELSSHSLGTWGVDLSDRDPSVTAGQDLYLSQNGGWIRKTELTETRPNAAYWRDLRVLSINRLAALLEDVAATRSPTTTIEGKASAFYRSFMDEKAVEGRGLEPLKPELTSIRNLGTKNQLAELMGRVAGPGTVRSRSVNGAGFGRALFALNIAQDDKDPSRYALFIGQAGLQLPGPEYYSDPKLADLKAAYQDYIAQVLTIIGWPKPETRAAEIVAFESQVAAASWSHEQMSDVVKTYNPMTLGELQRFAPGFDWAAFLRGAGLSKSRRFIVDARSAFPGIARAFAATPLSVLQARQAFATADEGSPLLNRALIQASFDFRGRKFAGARTMWPRSILAEQTVEAGAVDILSALYVARYSTPEALARANEMAVNIRKALDQRLAGIEWMSPATRQKNREKLARMEIHIGFPSHLLQYGGLSLRDDDLYGNVSRAAAWNWRHNVDRLNRPFDRSEWALSPVSYPTYGYLPTTNTMEITAGSLEPPFFDLKADEAVNYGAIGALIGQQMAAAFDNHGGRYDAEGRLSDWWTPEERKRLAAETEKLSAQYSAAEPLPGVHVKGSLVADEALDDLGGMLAALDAYHLSLRGAAAPELDGFTGDQRFFLGRAQMWRVKFSESFVRMQLATGANAHPSLRVNGPARNMEPFYQAFTVRPEDGMYLPPEARAHVW